MTDPTADLPARLERELTDRFTELGNPFSAMRRHEQGADGWPASHPVGPRQVAEVLRELLAAAPAGPAPATDGAALDHVRGIARRLANHAAGFQDVLDESDRGPWARTVGAAIAELCAVLDAPAAPVLPASADRAAALNEAAGTIAADAALRETEGEYALAEYGYELVRLIRPKELRRMADETQPAEARCGCPHPEGEHSVYGCADGCGCEWMPKRPPMDPVHILGIEAPRCDVEFEGGGTCTKAAGHRTPQNQDPHTPPAVGAQQPKETSNPRTVCVCGHTKGEHLTVSGRLLCDACDPDSTDNLVCRGFDAL